MKNLSQTQKDTYLYGSNNENTSTVKRFLVFLLDFSLFYIFFKLTLEIIKAHLTPVISAEVLLIVFSLFSFIFITFEYYFDGTFFKKIFRITSVKTNGRKLSYLAHFIKFFLRFIAIFFAIVRIWTMFIPLVLFINIFTNYSYYKIISEFLRGKMKGLWYDKLIGQKVIKLETVKHDYVDFNNLY